MKAEPCPETAIVNVKKTTSMKTIILNLLHEQLCSEQQGLDEHEAIKNFLTPFDGMPITKKIWKTLPPEWEVNSLAGMTHIKIKATGQNHLIAYHSDYVVKIDMLERYDAPYSKGARERMEQIQVILNNPVVLNRYVKAYTSIQKNYNGLKKQVKEMKDGLLKKFQNPADGEMLRLLRIPSGILSDIYFDKEY
jgi:hypothetical protein